MPEEGERPDRVAADALETGVERVLDVVEVVRAEVCGFSPFDVAPHELGLGGGVPRTSISKPHDNHLGEGDEMSAAGSIAAGDLELARRFARLLAEDYEAALFRVVLFGCRARGEPDEESDLDLFIAPAGIDRGGEIKGAARRIACDLTLEHGILVRLRG